MEHGGISSKLRYDCAIYVNVDDDTFCEADVYLIPFRPESLSWNPSFKTPCPKFIDARWPPWTAFSRVIPRKAVFIGADLSPATLQRVTAGCRSAAFDWLSIAASTTVAPASSGRGRPPRNSTIITMDSGPGVVLYAHPSSVEKHQVQHVKPIHPCRQYLTSLLF